MSERVYKIVVLGHLRPGTIVAGYEIQKSLGRGGMGDVYLARREGETRNVALKLLSTGLAKETRFRERFERESHMATSLEHPHIIPVYATGEVEGVRYIAMRYIDGPTLRDLIDDESPLDPRRVLSLLDQVASALDDAHGIGLVHRDIKPGNILIARSGATEFREHAYLTDFGVSKYTGSESGFTRTGQFVGTSLYAAPEQIQGEPIDGRTDVYAFGSVLFECLTGRVPFEKETEAALLWAQMFERCAPVSEIRPDLPAELDEVVAKAMAKAPGERFATCGEVVKAARAAVAAAKPTVEEVTPHPAAATVIKPVEGPDDIAPAGATVVRTADDASDGAPAGATVIKPSPEPDGGEAVLTAASAPVAAGETVIAATAPTEPALEPTELDEQAEREPAPAGVAAATVIAEDGPAAPDGSDLAATPKPVLVPKPEERSPFAPRTAGRERLVALGAGAIVILGLGAVLAVSLLGGDGGGTTTETEAGGEVQAPAILAAPAIGGTARAGSTLTARQGSWRNSPTEFTYQWRRCTVRGGGCASIAGAKASTYRLKDPDVGRRMRVAITASNEDGSGTALSRVTSVVAPSFKPPSNIAAPKLSGTAQVGQILTATKGTWRGTGPITPTYTWKRCNARGGKCVTIEGARGPKYTLRSLDIDHTIRVEVRASNKVGRATMASKATALVKAKPATPTPEPEPQPEPEPEPDPIPPPDPVPPPDP